MEQCFIAAAECRNIYLVILKKRNDVAGTCFS